jgi:CheY-like chemotaxis protein
VRNVEKILRRTIPKMIEIELSLTEPLPAIDADANQIEQIIMNLAVNARDAMPDGGKLVVATRSESSPESSGSADVEGQGTRVVLEVSDTGHGMDHETMQHVFEPFYTTKELGRGTGLGLAMVYGIVELHGAHIACESTPGTGTAFRIFFPAHDDAQRTEAEENVPLSASGHETILLVDDEELLRDLGRRILTKSGYTVLTATNGKEALVVYEKEKKAISLVLLDLVMPEMGGSRCLAELLRINPEVKVIIASGYMADLSVQSALESGAREFVSKPFRVNEMLQKVRQVLDSD